MASSTVTPTRTTVKTSDGAVSSIESDTLQIRYNGQMIAAFELSDAIKVAKMVLAYAGIENDPDILTGEAAMTTVELTEDDVVDLQAEMWADYRVLLVDALED